MRDIEKEKAKQECITIIKAINKQTKDKSILCNIKCILDVIYKHDIKNKRYADFKEKEFQNKLKSINQKREYINQQGPNNFKLILGGKRLNSNIV